MLVTPLAGYRARLDTEKAVSVSCNGASSRASGHEGGKCLVTKAGEPVDVAHNYPFSLRGREGQKQQHVFWGQIMLFEDLQGAAALVCDYIDVHQFS